MKVKGAIMFHQYNNVIKIKLTRPAVSAEYGSGPRKAIAKER